MTEGPLKGITIDIDTLAKEYRKAMGWDPHTGYPTKDSLAKLGLEELVKQGKYYPWFILSYR